jgi:hypothetical protein
LFNSPRGCEGCGTLQIRGTYCLGCVKSQEEAKAQAKEKAKTERQLAYQTWLAEMEATKAERTQLRREKDKETNRQRGKKRRARNKLLAIEHYGGCCKACGETRASFLNIDHVIEIGDKNREQGAHSTVAYVVKNGFPPGFQVLCWNCNWLKYLATRTNWQPNPLRQQVVEAYGGKCSCCDVSDVRLLTIDHVKGDGAIERRAMNTRNSRSLLRRLRDGGRSDDYAILCRNCNSGRAINGGVCPHYIPPIVSGTPRGVVA